MKKVYASLNGEEFLEMEENRFISTERDFVVKMSAGWKKFFVEEKPEPVKISMDKFVGSHMWSEPLFLWSPVFPERLIVAEMQTDYSITINEYGQTENFTEKKVVFSDVLTGRIINGDSLNLSHFYHFRLEGGIYEARRITHWCTDALGRDYTKVFTRLLFDRFEDVRAGSVASPPLIGVKGKLPDIDMAQFNTVSMDRLQGVLATIVVAAGKDAYETGNDHIGRHLRKAFSDLT